LRTIKICIHTVVKLTKKSNFKGKNYVFKVNEQINVQDFCSYENSNPSLNSDFKPIMTGIKTLAIFSAEFKS